MPSVSEPATASSKMCTAEVAPIAKALRMPMVDVADAHRHKRHCAAVLFGQAQPFFHRARGRRIELVRHAPCASCAWCSGRFRW